MSVGWVDHVVVPVPSVEEAAGAYERLGLRLTPGTRHEGLGTENRAMFVGWGDWEFYVELLGVHDREAAMRTSRGAMYLGAIEAGGRAERLMLGTDDIAGAVERLRAFGFGTGVESVYREGGAKVCDVAALEGLRGLGINAGLIQYVEPRAERVRRHREAGQFEQGFPLKRLDHLAVVAPDLAAATRAWVEGLGVDVYGEIGAPGMVIRQMKVGDVVVELLGPEGEESPLASRPPGLVSMCAWETAPPLAARSGETGDRRNGEGGGLDGAVALARERGFGPSEPRVGVLPGTRVATIPAGELAGVGMQLLEYV